MYNILMRILIAPLTISPSQDANMMLCDNIANLLKDEYHMPVICASEGNEFPSPVLHRPFSLFPPDSSDYDAWQNSIGAIRRPFLTRDISSVLSAIESFRPDLVISIDRMSAIIAATYSGIRCWAITCHAAYKKPFSEKNHVKTLNTVLDAYQIPPVTALSDLLHDAERRIVFGSPRMTPVPDGEGVDRIGVMSDFTNVLPETNRVLVYLGDVKGLRTSLQNMILDAFVGAPYEVYVSFDGCNEYTEDNVHVIEDPDYRLIPGSCVIIHDGNPYVSNISAASGVMQMAVTNSDCPRMQVAVSLRKTKTGIYLFEEELNMSNLYESYRRLLSDDMYKENTQELWLETVRLGDIKELLRLLD